MGTCQQTLRPRSRVRANFCTGLAVVSGEKRPTGRTRNFTALTAPSAPSPGSRRGSELPLLVNLDSLGNLGRSGSSRSVPWRFNLHQMVKKYGAAYLKTTFPPRFFSNNAHLLQICRMPNFREESCHEGPRDYDFRGACNRHSGYHPC